MKTLIYQYICLLLCTISRDTSVQRTASWASKGLRGPPTLIVSLIAWFWTDGMEGASQPWRELSDHGVGVDGENCSRTRLSFQ